MDLLSNQINMGANTWLDRNESSDDMSSVYFANNIKYDISESQLTYSDQTALLHHALHHLSLTGKLRVVLVMACLIVVPSFIIFIIYLLKDRRERRKRNAVSQRTARNQIKSAGRITLTETQHLKPERQQQISYAYRYPPPAAKILKENNNLDNGSYLNRGRRNDESPSRSSVERKVVINIPENDM